MDHKGLRSRQIIKIITNRKIVTLERLCMTVILQHLVEVKPVPPKNYHTLTNPLFIQKQDVVTERVSEESATVRPKNKEFRPHNYSHFEVVADRLESQTSNGRASTKCTFQPGEKCVIKGLMPFTNYSIRVRVCDQSLSCSPYRVGEGLRTLGDGELNCTTCVEKQMISVHGAYTGDLKLTELCKKVLFFNVYRNLNPLIRITILAILFDSLQPFDIFIVKKLHKKKTITYKHEVMTLCAVS